MHQLTFPNQDIVDHYEIVLGGRRLHLVVTNGRVSAAPQAAPWTKGQPITRVIAWYARQGASVERRDA
jgi:transposase